MSLDFKKAPKWAYYASGIVVVGVIGTKVWSHRGGGATPEAIPASTDPNAPTSTYATTSTVPVFMGGDQSGGGSGGDGQSYGSLVDGAFGLATSALNSANATTSTISDAFSNTSNAYNQAQGQYSDIVGRLAGQALSNQNDYANSIAAIMAAGQAPPAVQQTPVINYSPPQSQAPVSIPANPSADPTYGGQFTHLNKKTGQYYRIEYDAKTHNTYHIYHDGRKVRDATD